MFLTQNNQPYYGKILVIGFIESSVNPLWWHEIGPRIFTNHSNVLNLLKKQSKNLIHSLDEIFSFKEFVHYFNLYDKNNYNQIYVYNNKYKLDVEKYSKDEHLTIEIPILLEWYEIYKNKLKEILNEHIKFCEQEIANQQQSLFKYQKIMGKL